MSLDLSPLGSAIAQLEKALGYANADFVKSDEGLREQIRNSVIQCFEFTYELAHKMLKRHLEETAANPEEIDLATFQNLIRMGNEKGIVRSDWGKWRTYRQARTDSSHTYDEARAEAVFEIAPDFLDEARHLFEQLSQRGAEE